MLASAPTLQPPFTPSAAGCSTTCCRARCRRSGAQHRAASLACRCAAAVAAACHVHLVLLSRERFGAADGGSAVTVAYRICCRCPCPLAAVAAGAADSPFEPTAGLPRCLTSLPVTPVMVHRRWRFRTTRWLARSLGRGSNLAPCPLYRSCECHCCVSCCAGQQFSHGCCSQHTHACGCATSCCRLLTLCAAQLKVFSRSASPPASSLTHPHTVGSCSRTGCRASCPDPGATTAAGRRCATFTWTTTPSEVAVPAD